MRLFEFHVGNEHARREYQEVPAGALWEGLRDTTTAHGISHVKNARGQKRVFFKLNSNEKLH